MSSPTGFAKSLLLYKSQVRPHANLNAAGVLKLASSLLFKLYCVLFFIVNFIFEVSFDKFLPFFMPKLAYFVRC